MIADSCIGQHINDDATSLTAIIATTTPPIHHHHPIRSNVPITSTTNTTTSDYSVPIISVVAVTPTWGIGYKGTLPWHPLNKSLPRDLGR